jgi:hypothetical protein
MVCRAARAARAASVSPTKIQSPPDRAFFCPNLACSARPEPPSSAGHTRGGDSFLTRALVDEGDGFGTVQQCRPVELQLQAVRAGTGAVAAKQRELEATRSSTGAIEAAQGPRLALEGPTPLSAAPGVPLSWLGAARRALGRSDEVCLRQPPAGNARAHNGSFGSRVVAPVLGSGVWRVHFPRRARGSRPPAGVGLLHPSSFAPPGRLEESLLAFLVSPALDEQGDIDEEASEEVRVGEVERLLLARRSTRRRLYATCLRTPKEPAALLCVGWKRHARWPWVTRLAPG